MNKLEHQFFGDAKKMGLTPVEKSAIWDQISTRASSKNIALTNLEKADTFTRIAHHMRSHPIAPLQREGIGMFWHFHKLMASALIAVLIIGAGGGTAAYAAQSAVPGDTLYALKVDVTEPIIDKAVSLNPEWAAEWERRRLKRRLKEAEHLSEHKIFTEDHRVQLQKRVEDRMQHLEEHLTHLPEEQRAIVQNRVDDVMMRHEAFLERVAAGAPVTPEEVRAFKSHVQGVRTRARDTWNRRGGDGPLPPMRGNGDSLPSTIRMRDEQLAPPLPKNLLPSDMQNDDPSVQSPAEGWLSGRKRTTRNRVDPQGSRGFESPSLRHPATLPATPRLFYTIPKHGEAEGEDGSLRQENQPIRLRPDVPEQVIERLRDLPKPFEKARNNQIKDKKGPESNGNIPSNRTENPSPPLRPDLRDKNVDLRL